MCGCRTGATSTERRWSLCRFSAMSVLFLLFSGVPAGLGQSAEAGDEAGSSTSEATSDGVSAPTPPGPVPTPTFAEQMAEAMDAGDEAADLVIRDALAAGQERASGLIFAFRADEPAGLREEVVRYGERNGISNEVLIEAMLDLLGSSSDSMTPRLLAAIGRATGQARSRSVVRRILDFAKTDARASAQARIRAAVFEALEYQTGRFDIGRDMDAWEAWWSEVEWVPESAWQMHLTDAHASHARAAEGRASHLADRVEALYARLHARMDENERSALMVELLRDDLPRARAFGFQLAFRALLNAKPLKDEVLEAAEERLTDGVPALRAQAARLLEKRRRPGLDERVARLLLEEEEPDVAAAMMRVTAHQPHARALPAVLRWLGTDGAVYDASVDALLTMHRESMVKSPEILSEVRTILESRLDDRPTPAGLRLLGRLGEMDRLLPFLTSEDGPLAVAAGEAVMGYEEALPRLLGACEGRPALWESTVRASMSFRPTADGYLMCRDLPSPASVDRESLLASYGALLSPEDLLRVAMAESDAPFRLQLLSRIAEPGFVMEDSGSDRTELVAALIGTYKELQRPESVLSLLDRLPEPVQRQMDTERVYCLLWLNRMADAVAITEAHGVSASTWIEAWEKFSAADHGEAIRAEIQLRFESELTDEQRAILGI